MYISFLYIYFSKKILDENKNYESNISYTYIAILDFTYNFVLLNEFAYKASIYKRKEEKKRKSKKKENKFTKNYALERAPRVSFYYC